MTGLTGSGPPGENAAPVPLAEQASRLLREARRTRQPIEGLPQGLQPESLADAYAIQRAFIASAGDTPGGYKVGCTSKRAQEILNVDAPVWGTVVSEAIYDSPCWLVAEDFIFCGIEPEVAAVVAHDLPPRDEPYTPEEMGAATARLHPAIEIVTSAYGEAWSKVGANHLVADNGVHACLILGPGMADWTHLDLATIPVALEVDGKPHSDGVGANALGGAMHVMAWLANALQSEGLHLKAGDVVTTGVVTDVPILGAGQEARARFEGLGEVSLAFRS